MSLRRLSDLLPKEKLRGVPSRTPVRVPSGTLWPHGEFSYGYVAQRPDGGEWEDDPFVGMGVDDVAMAERAGQGPGPLDLSDVPKSHKRPRRGLRGITGYGRQMVKAAGFLMCDLWPRHRRTFATVTLPQMSRDARRSVVESWPEILRQTVQHLRRKLEQQGLPAVIVSVTEIQPKRLLSTGEGHLHLHLLWLNRPGKKGGWAVCPVGLSAWFEAALKRIAGVDFDGRVNVDVKPVKGDAARYLAKYMSKGGALLVEALEDWGADNCPRQWWNLSGPARRMVGDRLAKGADVGALLESWVEYTFATGDDSWVEFLRHVEIDLDGVSVTVGWRGRMTAGSRVDAFAMLKSQHC